MNRITLDGYDLFKAIGSHRETFAAAEDKITKAAEAIVLAHIKASDVSIVSLSGLRSAIGGEYFALAMDYLDVKDLTKVLKKIDPHFAAASAADAELRQRVQKLTQGLVAPAEKAVRTRAVAPKAPAKPKASKAAKQSVEWPSSMNPPTRKAS